MQAPRLPRPQLQLGKQSILLSAAVIAGVAASIALQALPAQAQRQVAKIGSICPMGYVDMFNGRCSTLGLMTYTLQPTNGDACPSGWMNVGGGYCREK